MTVAVSARSVVVPEQEDVIAAIALAAEFANTATAAVRIIDVILENHGEEEYSNRPVAALLLLRAVRELQISLDISLAEGVSA
jgi:hypothetical protein